MSSQTTTYTAFSGMSPIEKNALISFICENAGNSSKSEVQEALDYALKRKPSFGGFVVVITDGKPIIGAIIVNQTGMKGYNPNNICVYIISLDLLLLV